MNAVDAGCVGGPHLRGTQTGCLYCRGGASWGYRLLLTVFVPGDPPDSDDVGRAVSDALNHLGGESAAVEMTVQVAEPVFD